MGGKEGTRPGQVVRRHVFDAGDASKRTRSALGATARLVVEQRLINGREQRLGLGGHDDVFQGLQRRCRRLCSPEGEVIGRKWHLAIVGAAHGELGNEIVDGVLEGQIGLRVAPRRKVVIRVESRREHGAQGNRGRMAWITLIFEDRRRAVCPMALTLVQCGGLGPKSWLTGGIDVDFAGFVIRPKAYPANDRIVFGRCLAGCPCPGSLPTRWLHHGAHRTVLLHVQPLHRHGQPPRIRHANELHTQRIAGYRLAKAIGSRQDLKALNRRTAVGIDHTPGSAGGTDRGGGAGIEDREVHIRCPSAGQTLHRPVQIHPLVQAGRPGGGWGVLRHLLLAQGAARGPDHLRTRIQGAPDNE